MSFNLKRQQALEILPVILPTSWAKSRSLTV